MRMPTLLPFGEGCTSGEVIDTRTRSIRRGSGHSTSEGWDRRRILADHISGTAVLEYGPTEILPQVGTNWKALRVSADRVAKPAAHTRAESRGSRPSNADAAERLTLCWREMDSNPRSPREDEPRKVQWTTADSKAPHHDRPAGGGRRIRTPRSPATGSSFCEA